ncbi:MAG: Hpt domain-containing protein, partial [Leptospiraceae bacterium]|nr:Hpt domain-containing protein [Leptospiraceae bacterium]
MDLKDARGVFISECDELLQEMETALLNDETDAESIRRVFRVIHTIKGSAGIFGFTAIQEFTHDLEFLLDRARSGELTITDEIVRFLLECRDHISDLVAVISELDDDTELEINTSLKEKGARLMAATRDYLGRPEPGDAHESVTTDEKAQPNRSFLIKLRFHEDLFFHGMDPLSFIRYLSQLGSIDGVETIIDKVPPLSQMDSEKCYLGFDIKFSGPVSESVIREVFEFVEQDCDINIQALTANENVAASRNQTDESTVIDDSLTSDPDAISQSSQTTSAKSSGQSVENADGNAASESDNTALTASAASNETRRTTAPQMENERSSAQPNESAQARKESESRATIERTSRDVSGQIKRESHNIRVDAEKLDFLVNLVGELVVSVAHMSQVAEDSGHTGVLEAAYEVNKMVTELRDNTFRLRMIPIGGVFSRFQRIVYDVGHELGKDVSLIVHGGETELDKNIIEKISDPLMHLVRNAIDHGIESPEIRRSAGKSTHG